MWIGYSVVLIFIILLLITLILKNILTLFRLICAYTWYIDNVDSDSHPYGLSYNDSGLFSDSSAGSDITEKFFRQDNDSYEDEYLQELDIDTNDNNNNDFELDQQKQKRICKPKKDDNIFSFFKDSS